jgi:hypothetical protein
MARYSKTTQGGKTIYNIKGKTYQQLAGSRIQVWNGTAYKTSGGLKKDNLVQIGGRVKSKSKHISASKEQRLLQHGYGAKTGTFGNIKLRNFTKKHRPKQRQ